VGLETGDRDLLKEIAKGATPEEMIEAGRKATMSKALEIGREEGWESMENYLRQEVRSTLQKMFPARPPASQTTGGSGASLLQEVHDAYREDDWTGIEILADRRRKYIA
jgi:hypothetical protein